MRPVQRLRRGHVAPDRDHDVLLLLKPLPGIPAPHERRRLVPPPVHVAKTILAFAKANNLTVNRVHKHPMLVRLEGSVEALSNAFGLDLAEFEAFDGMHVGHDSDAHVEVPDALADIVHAILPDRRPEPHPKVRNLPHADLLPKAMPTGSTVQGAIEPQYTPSALRSMYGIPDSATGKGQTIAIIGLGGGYYEEDMDAYFAALGIPKPEIIRVGDNHVADVDVVRDVMHWMNTRNATLESHPADQLATAIQTVETTMDIQAAAAFAPGARIVVYTTPTTSLQDMLDVLDVIHDDVEHKPNVVSCSFAVAEGSLPPYTDLGLEYALQQLVDDGMTVCVASGDFGAQGVSQFASATAPQVTWPAASEWVVACGGTQIVRPLPKPTQVVFREVLGAPVGQMASGGGFSDKNECPPWQADVMKDWAQRTQAEPPNGRGVPDVALNAHLESSFAIRVAGYDGTAGGTSAAAPVMAAWVACLNETTGQATGHLTPRLYKPDVADTYLPITRGDSDITDDVPGYEAGPGWDPCTGMGSPSAKLWNALVGE